MMGRRPKSADAVPRLRKRRQKSGRVFYYYDHGLVDGARKEEPLGSDYALAIKRWAEIEHESRDCVAKATTFRHVADAYRAEVIPTKSRGTQRQNLVELAKLIEFFDDPPGPLEAIQPQHVRQYLRWRRDAPTSANRERALLSHLWNWARAMGYTALANPCTGVQGHRERGRDIYVEDDAYRAVYEAACVPLCDAMDLAYLTGQRPSDVLKMDERDVRDGNLHLRQTKTGAALRIAIEGELVLVLARIATRKAQLVVRSTRLIVDERGQPLAPTALRSRFDRARKATGQTWQFRDLRAKAASDKADSADIRQAQRQLGHASVTMTEHYVRQRRGDRVTPTK